MRLRDLLCVLAFSTACGVQAQQMPVPETYVDYLKLANQLTCEARLRCCGSLCSDADDATFFKLLPRTVDDIAQGLIGYDKQAATTCLSNLATRYASCDAATAALPPLTPCDKVLIPQNPAGGPCDTKPVSCTPDSICQSGRCVALPKAGQTCNPSGSPPCAAGAYCMYMTQMYVCVSYATAGQPCTSKPCDASASLICLPSGVCGAPQPIGSPCTQPANCLSGFCDSAQGTCQSPPNSPTIREQLCTAAEPGMPS